MKTGLTCRGEGPASWAKVQYSNERPTNDRGSARPGREPTVISGGPAGRPLPPERAAITAAAAAPTATQAASASQRTRRGGNGRRPGPDARGGSR